MVVDVDGRWKSYPDIVVLTGSIYSILCGSLDESLKTRGPTSQVYYFLQSQVKHLIAS